MRKALSIVLFLLLAYVAYKYLHYVNALLQSPVKQRASPERTARLSGTNGV